MGKGSLSYRFSVAFHVPNHSPEEMLRPLLIDAQFWPESELARLRVGEVHDEGLDQDLRRGHVERLDQDAELVQEPALAEGDQAVRRLVEGNQQVGVRRARGPGVATTAVSFPPTAGGARFASAPRWTRSSTSRATDATLRRFNSNVLTLRLGPSASDSRRSTMDLASMWRFAVVCGRACQVTPLRA